MLSPKFKPIWKVRYIMRTSEGEFELAVCPLCPSWKDKILAADERMVVTHRICERHWGALVKRLGKEGAEKKAKTLRYFLMLARQLLYPAMISKGARECLIEALDMVKKTIQDLPPVEKVAVELAKASPSETVTLHFPEETFTITKKVTVQREVPPS